VRFQGKFDLFVGLHFTCRLKIMLSSLSEYPYVVRVLLKLLSERIENA